MKLKQLKKIRRERTQVRFFIFYTTVNIRAKEVRYMFYKRTEYKSEKI